MRRPSAQRGTERASVKGAQVPETPPTPGDHTFLPNMSSGIAYALGAYLLWGIAPLYFHLLVRVPTVEILAHRVAWSVVLMGALVVALGRTAALRAALRQRAVLLRFAATAVLIACNWGIYIGAVNSGHVVDASLGYFINPLVSVALGTLVLHERLRPLQWVAVALAAVGVAWLTWLAGTLPWIGLALAASFGLYGLLRKTGTLGAVEGLALETALLAPLALAYLAARGHGGPLGSDLTTALLLLASGPVTALPLMLFAAAARRLPLATLGLLQYLAPTLQLVVGVLIFGEPFGWARAAGFAAIWASLGLLAVDGLGARPSAAPAG